MKRFIALTVVLTAVTGLTICFAGTERYSSKEVAPVVPECDWSGFYLGLNVGIASIHTDVSDLDNWWDYATHSVEDTNFAGGGQAGYNWQKGAFVFGLEVDADYLNVEASRPLDRETIGAWRGEIDFQGSFRGRAGLAVDRALIYATAGLAVSHGRSAFLSEEEGFNAYQDEWQAGYVVGFGAEYAFNCHWSARLEGLYSHYPTSRGTIPTNEGDYRFDFQNEVWNARLGINYKFGSGR